MATSGEKMHPLFCAAIDFGTTYTGLAFAEWNSKKVVACTWEQDTPHGVELKAPTAVLFDPGKDFSAFGYDAVKKYSRMNERNKNDWYYFERFKMELHQQEGFNENLMLRSTNNPEKRMMKAVTVFSAAMRFLKDKLLEMFKTSRYSANDTDIRWVVTVPAIWRASARQFMRLAAYEAGLCSKSDPHNLIISLEPESAALFVHDYLQLKDKGLTDDALEVSMEGLNLCDIKYSDVAFKKYLILDCGGGTVDVCVHRLLNDQGTFTVRECYRATGGAWGGIYVDKKFFEFLEKIFTTEFINYAKSTLLTAWTDICRDFEFWKRQVQAKDDVSIEEDFEKEIRYDDNTFAVDNNDDNNYDDDNDDDDDDDDDNADTFDDVAPIGLPYDFIVECQKHHGGKHISQIIKRRKVKGVKLQMGKLIIPGKIIRMFLMSQITKIVSHIRTLKKTNECHGFNAIFLVGGFSECKLLRSVIEKTFGKMCTIVVPICPSLAIVKGSIKFGFNPTVISQRVSQFTYGLGKMRKFQADDKEEYKYINGEGKVYCKNIFLEIMQELSLITKENSSFVTNFSPVEKDQTGISVSLFKSKRSNIKYTTEEGVEMLGHLYVPLQGTGLDRTVQVTVDFSGTEIFASVKNLLTNEIDFKSVDFLSSEC